MSPSIGAMGEFNPDNEEFEVYIERLKLFLAANSVHNNKKVAVMLTLLGSHVYSVLRDLCSPESPCDKNFDDLIEVLSNHYAPTRNIIAERFKFNRCRQGPTQSVNEYVAQLKKLANTCKYYTFLDEMLRDKLIEGIRDVTLQRELLKKDDLTFKSALEIAQQHELTAKTSAEIQKATETGERCGTTAQSIDRVGVASRRGNKTTAQSRDRGKPTLQQYGNNSNNKKCYRCNGTSHLASKCKYKSYECNNCKRIGHLSKACRSAKINYNENQEINSQGVDHTSGEVNTLFHVNDAMVNKVVQPYRVTMLIEDVPIVMELDTGSGLSVISYETYCKYFDKITLQDTDCVMRSYSNQILNVKGKLQVSVSHNNQRENLDLYVVDNNGPALLGRQWLEKLKINWTEVVCVNSIEDVIGKYSSVFDGKLGKIKTEKVKLRLKKDAQPVFMRARPVPFALQDKVDTALKDMVSNGILSQVDSSEWATPLVIVPKKDNSVRICGDYRLTVNKNLESTTYPLPNPTDIFASLANGDKFTVLDLDKAYHQLELEEDDKSLLTINTTKGLYRYNRLVFGLSSSPLIFQKVMDSVLAGIPNCSCYLDDIIITGRNDQAHLMTLNSVLCKLKDVGIKLKKDKCKFFQNSVEYLGHVIDKNGLHVTESKTEALRNAPTPTDVSQLKSFLGLVNYYSNFVKDLSTTLKPLYELLKDNVKFMWSQQCQRAFDNVKEKLSNASVLAHYDPCKKIILSCDASSYGIGAVISHVDRQDIEKPIAFASRTLSHAERNYSQIEREALSLVFGVTKFHKYLYGRNFTLITDHKPLLAIFGSKKGVSRVTAARLERWSLALGAYNYDIVYKKGSDHANADAFSRLPLAIQPSESENRVHFIDQLPVSSVQIKKATSKDPILSKVVYYTVNGWPNIVDESLIPYKHRAESLSVEEGCLLMSYRVIIPVDLRSAILHELHADHVGIVRMKAIARSVVWWPGIDRDIESVVNNCASCQCNQKLPAESPLHSWPVADGPWERIHIDYAEKDGKSYLLGIDSYTRWPEICLVPSTTSSKTIECMRSWFAAYGLPKTVVSDNGPQFRSMEFTEFLKNNGVKHILTPPYHSPSNGMAERLVQSFKLSLAKNSNMSCLHALHNFLYSYRNTPHSSTGV